MYIVVADGNVVFSTDIDDVAWEFSQEQEGDFEKVYVEEVYQNQFDSEGKYITTQEDIITLQEIVDAEQYYKDDEMRPRIKPKPTKKKAKKASRKYWEEKVYSLSAAATRRMLQKLNINFDKDESELALKDVLEAKLKTMLKQNDEFADYIFEELGNCSSLTMSIDSLFSLFEGKKNKTMDALKKDPDVQAYLSGSAKEERESVKLAKEILMQTGVVRDAEIAVKSRIHYKDEDALCSREELVAILSVYVKEWERCSEDVTPDVNTVRMLTDGTKVKTDPNADAIAETLDKKELSELLDFLVRGTKYRSYILAWARFAEEDKISQPIWM